VDRSLRIAILLNPFDLAVKGGEYAPALARELLGRGHNVRGFGAPPGVIPRSGADPGPDGSPARPEAPGVVGFRPDAIVAYDALSPAAFLGARAARRLRVPLLLVEAGTAVGGNWPTRFLRWCGERMWGPFVRRMAQAVVALDPIAREQALAEGFAADRIHVLPPGVDLATFRPGLTSNLIARHRITGRMLLYIGRVSTERGLEVLIQAFGRTIGQGRDWVLVIAGDGPVRDRQVLRAQVDRLGIGSFVSWLPSPRLEEMPGLLGTATLLAVPANDSRVRGIHIPRALACGLPVLASNLPRFADLLEQDGTGLLVEPGSVVAWSEALGRASGSPEARRRWSRRARAVAEERLDWALVAREFEDLLRAACGSRAVAATDPAPDELPVRAVDLGS
jgi:glycosyltransferase involved in cell wall biosynthesis